MDITLLYSISWKRLCRVGVNSSLEVFDRIVWGNHLATEIWFREILNYEFNFLNMYMTVQITHFTQFAFFGEVVYSIYVVNWYILGILLHIPRWQCRRPQPLSLHKDQQLYSYPRWKTVPGVLWSPLKKLQQHSETNKQKTEKNFTTREGRIASFCLHHPISQASTAWC